jgi:hypothetical protein
VGLDRRNWIHIGIYNSQTSSKRQAGTLGNTLPFRICSKIAFFCRSLLQVSFML